VALNSNQSELAMNDCREPEATVLRGDTSPAALHNLVGSDHLAMGGVHPVTGLLL